MYDPVAFAYQLVDQRRIQHRAVDELKVSVIACAGKVLQASGAEIVECDDRLATGQQRIDKMGADESGSSSNQVLRVVRHGVTPCLWVGHCQGHVHHRRREGNDSPEPHKQSELIDRLVHLPRRSEDKMTLFA
ncbi:hypothetical protein GCM10010381_02190 [Streptomyces xantholiticus]|nr:hypothetical protein GCM10010381_02190 [Streptomyces xantholiticus]